MISTPKIKEPPTTTTRYEGVIQPSSHCNTTGSCRASFQGSPAPAEFGVTVRRVEQLRLIPLDGAWTEPYTPPARAKGNVAATAATMRVGRAQ